MTADRLRGRAGQERRARWLAAHPLCSHCQRKGIVRQATQVDHRVALCNGGPDDESNFDSVCDPCHVIKTALDKGQRPRYGCDINGNSLDPNHAWNKGRN